MLFFVKHKEVYMRWYQVLLFSGVLGLGCFATREPAGAPNTAIIVKMAPPASKAEAIKASPGAGYFWVKGHWAWSQEQWVWVGGYWEKQRSGSVWVMPHYEQRGGQQVYVLGGWVPQSGVEPFGSQGAAKGAQTP
jgi:hypothetical protein